MRHYLYVAIGSGLGGLARYASVAAGLAVFGSAFPLGTLFVNVVGSALIGVIAGLARAESRYILRPETRSLLAVGFCGGFTTFSFFAWQTYVLSAVSAWLATIYVVTSVALSLAAVWAGFAFTVRLSSR